MRRSGTPTVSSGTRPPSPSSLTAWHGNDPEPLATGAHGFDEPMKLFMQIETGDVGAEPTSITPAVVNMNVDWAVVYTPS